MAFLHTNYLTGNDTTGDGSIALPYKTAGKALTVAVSNDFIKVAGGQWTPITGDFTFTNSSLTVDTSTSQVGIIAVNDVLTFEDGQFGFDKFHVRVTAVTATTLTLSTCWSGPTQITSALYMINVFHYNTALNANVNFESWVPASVAPLGRTGITISGGWSSDYTTQNGWTMVRSTAATPATVFFANVTAGTLGAWENNLVFDRIFLCRANCLFQTNAAGATSFAVKEFGVIRGDNNGIFLYNPTTRYAGLFNVDANTPVTMYVCPETNTSQFTNINSINASNPSRSSSTNITVYQQIGATTTGGFTSSYMTFGVVNTATQASPNKITMHTRSSYTTAGGTGPFVPGYPVAYFYGLGGDGRGSFYLQKGYVYCNAPTFFYLIGGINYYTQIEDLEFVGPYASAGNSLAFIFSGVGLVDLSNEGKTIEQFRPTAGFGATGEAYTSNYPLTKIAQTNLSSIQVKDAEGLKTLDIFNNIYFKDPVNNWLRVTGAGSWGSNLYNEIFTSSIYKIIGVKEKINTPFTVTVRLKTDDAVGVWNQIALQYGPNVNQSVVVDITPTSSFEDYYITIDPATYSDWNTFIFPMYIGLRSKTWNTNSNNQQAPICYVESINIS